MKYNPAVAKHPKIRNSIPKLEIRVCFSLSLLAGMNDLNAFSNPMDQKNDKAFVKKRNHSKLPISDFVNASLTKTILNNIEAPSRKACSAWYDLVVSFVIYCNNASNAFDSLVNVRNYFSPILLLKTYKSTMLQIVILFFGYYR